MHNDGGVNCFIFNDPKLFWSLHPTSISVRQLDGSHISANGCGIVVIRPSGPSQLLALWPSCLYPAAPKNILSPNTTKHYLLLHSVRTDHTSSLQQVSIKPTINIKFPSLPTDLKTTGLDFFRTGVVVPPKIRSVAAVQHLTVQLPPRVVYSKASIMTRALMHQRFGHISDDLIDMCKEQTLIGLPRFSPPIYAYNCPVYSLEKIPQFKKGKTVTTDRLKPGELLHMDFAFWNIVSRRGFTAVLTIVDACSRFI
jgi:hypothetical protein